MLPSGRTARDLRIVGKVLWSVAGAPWVLLYPLLGAGAIVAGLGVMTLGSFWIVAELHEGLVFVVFVAVPLVYVPLVVGTVATAYCYEIDAAISGRRPIPLSGLLVTLRRFHRVLLFSLAISVVGFISYEDAGQQSGGGSYLYGLLGEAERFGLKVLVDYGYPVLATTDDSMFEGFQRFHDVATDDWGTVILTTVGVRTVMNSLAHAIVLPAFLVGAVHFLLYFVAAHDWVPHAAEYGVPLEPLGLATLPLALFALTFAVPVAFKFGVGYLLNTIVYRYALDGELPEGIAVGAGEMAELGVGIREPRPDERSEAPTGSRTDGTADRARRSDGGDD